MGKFPVWPIFIFCRSVLLNRNKLSVFIGFRHIIIKSNPAWFFFFYVLSLVKNQTKTMPTPSSTSTSNAWCCFKFFVVQCRSVWIRTENDDEQFIDGRSPMLSPGRTFIRARVGFHDFVSGFFFGTTFFEVNAGLIVMKTSSSLPPFKPGHKLHNILGLQTLIGIAKTKNTVLYCYPKTFISKHRCHRWNYHTIDWILYFIKSRSFWTYPSFRDCWAGSRSCL